MRESPHDFESPTEASPSQSATSSGTSSGTSSNKDSEAIDRLDPADRANMPRSIAISKPAPKKRDTIDDVSIETNSNDRPGSPQKPASSPRLLSPFDWMAPPRAHTRHTRKQPVFTGASHESHATLGSNYGLDTGLGSGEPRLPKSSSLRASSETSFSQGPTPNNEPRCIEFEQNIGHEQLQLRGQPSGMRQNTPQRLVSTVQQPRRQLHTLDPGDKGVL